MKKILILVNDFSTIYNFRRELVKTLLELRYKVVISLPKNIKNNYFVDMGCTIEEINLTRSGTNPISEFVLLFKYKKMIKRVKPYLVLTYTLKPNIYGSLACQSLKIPYINNITGLGSVFYKHYFLKKLLLLLQKKSYKKSAAIFFQNIENKNYFEKLKIIKSGILLPGSGVNLELHSFEKYPSSENKIRFITVSRIRQDKGIDELFEAIKILSNSYSNLEFHIVGWYEDEKYENKMNNMINKYNVIYHGKKIQEEVHELIKKSHCLIHPSYHEGMANVILEAASSGRPVLTSNIPGCKDAVDDGITGFLFEVKNSRSIVDSIIKFLSISNNEKEKMGYMGRIKMEKEFDRNIVVEAYVREIKKII